jgi:hypothetical protein
MTKGGADQVFKKLMANSSKWDYNEFVQVLRYSLTECVTKVTTPEMPGSGPPVMGQQQVAKIDKARALAAAAAAADDDNDDDDDDDDDAGGSCVKEQAAASADEEDNASDSDEEGVDDTKSWDETAPASPRSSQLTTPSPSERQASRQGTNAD